jgi:hypothetical protein
MSVYRGANATLQPVGTQVPGTPAPRTGARVVAHRVANPSTIQYARGVQGPASATFGPSPVGAEQSLEQHLQSCMEFNEYVNTHTGERAVVPSYIDPTTGARRPLVRLSPEYIPALQYLHAHAADGGGESLGMAIQRCFARIVHGDRAPVPPPAPVPAPAPAPVPNPTDLASRRLLFDENEADIQDNEERDARRLAVPAAILAGLQAHGGKLELQDIADFLVDLKTAIKLADPDTHVMLYDPDWRDGLDARGIRMNKRIATAVNGALNPTADNAKYFKSLMRKADASDRPGILCSGMDLLEEIDALVTKRSLGEINLTKDVVIKDLMFEAGAAIPKSRLRANEIEQYFALKPEKERTTPNALLHEYLSKIPDAGDEGLKLRKEHFEAKLYAAEMNGLPSPWTDDELINNIAVALARAKATRQVAAVDAMPPASAGKVQLTPKYRCSGCGATGEHLSQECPKKCNNPNGRCCGFNFCPGARGEVCAACFDTPPSKRSPPLTNFFGNPLVDSLVKRLDAAWLGKHPGKEISSVEALAVDSTDNDGSTDEDDSDDDGGFGLAYDRASSSR